MRGLITTRTAPALFVLLWSTGFTGIRYGIPYAPPFTFIAVRMAIASILLALISLAITKRFTHDLSTIGKSVLVGVTIHGAYLGGCFYGVKQGMPAGITALICSLQPVLVSLFSSIFFQEKLSIRKWLGLGLGLTGLVLVIAPKLSGTTGQELPMVGVAAIFIALLGGTSGTLLQKKFGSGVEVLSGTSWQYVATGILMGSLALIFEGDQSITWNASFIFSLTWLIVALSIGAILILYFLLSHSSASSVSSLYYLVPAVTAVEAYFLFGEKIGLVTGLGTLVTIAGVALVVSQGSQGRVREVTNL
jgi:drug/metabolite transporter (DMT)-like permease